MNVYDWANKTVEYLDPVTGDLITEPFYCGEFPTESLHLLLGLKSGRLSLQEVHTMLQMPGSYLDERH